MGLSVPRRGKSGLIVIRDGDSPSNLAASFARVWQLDASSEARLTRKRELAIGTLQLDLLKTVSDESAGFHGSIVHTR